jgi:hypothetical protein
METDFVIVDGVVVPESALRRERVNRYGEVPDLDDEEPADPAELERQVFLEEFGPILALPVKGKPNPIQPAIDENGGVDWGAFGSVDFERTMPKFDKARYKADKLREELENVLIMFDTVKERLPRVAAKVLKYLRMGIIETEHLATEDMRYLARYHRRAEKLRAEIRQLEKVT